MGDIMPAVNETHTRGGKVKKKRQSKRKRKAKMRRVEYGKVNMLLLILSHIQDG